MNSLAYSHDPSVRARARGRLLTSAVARIVSANERGEFWIDMRSVLAGEQPRYTKSKTASIPPEKRGQPITSGPWSDAKEAQATLWKHHTPQFGEDHPLR